MEKTHITHVDDGFVFLGIGSFASEGRTGTCPSSRPYPGKGQGIWSQTETLFANHDAGNVDMVDRLNRQLAGWAAFYKFTDFTARNFRRIDHVVF